MLSPVPKISLDSAQNGQDAPQASPMISGELYHSCGRMLKVGHGSGWPDDSRRSSAVITALRKHQA